LKNREKLQHRGIAGILFKSCLWTCFYKAADESSTD